MPSRTASFILLGEVKIKDSDKICYLKLIQFKNLISLIPIQIIGIQELKAQIARVLITHKKDVFKRLFSNFYFFMFSVCFLTKPSFNIC